MRIPIFPAVFSSICALLILPVPARAEPGPLSTADSPVAPDVTFSEAVRLFKSGDAARALPLFVRLGEQTNSPNVHLYVGYCHRDLGSDLAAHRAFARVLKLAVDSRDSKYDATREAAQLEMAKLSFRLASLTVSMVDLPPGFTVRLDDLPIDPTLLDSPMVVEPGVHRVDAAADGYKPIARTMTVAAGGAKAIAILFEKLPDRKPDLSAGAGEAGIPQGSTGSRWKAWGLIAGGLGVVGLGTFAVAGLKARATYNGLQTECFQGCPDSSHRGQVDDGKAYQTVANVGLLLGVAGTLTGATLYFWGAKREKSGTPSVEVSPGLAKLSYAGSF